MNTSILSAGESHELQLPRFLPPEEVLDTNVGFATLLRQARRLERWTRDLWEDIQKTSLEQLDAILPAEIWQAWHRRMVELIYPPVIDIPTWFPTVEDLITFTGAAIRDLSSGLLLNAWTRPSDVRIVEARRNRPNRPGTVGIPLLANVYIEDDDFQNEWFLFSQQQVFGDRFFDSFQRLIIGYSYQHDAAEGTTEEHEIWLEDRGTMGRLAYEPLHQRQPPPGETVTVNRLLPPIIRQAWNAYRNFPPYVDGYPDALNNSDALARIDPRNGPDDFRWLLEDLHERVIESVSLVRAGPPRIEVSRVVPLQNAQLAERAGTDEQRPPDEKDGPCAPHSFRYGKQLVTLGPNQWKLLECLWGAGIVSVADAFQHVYGRPIGEGNEYKQNYNRLKSLKRDTNNKIDCCKCQIEDGGKGSASYKISVPNQ